MVPDSRVDRCGQSYRLILVTGARQRAHVSIIIFIIIIL
jgi:hypothetical protein